MESFFIPINSKNVPIYFAHAIVAPPIYLKNVIDEFQGRYSENLILTTGPWTGENDCALEIVLDYKEKDHLLPASSDGFAFSLNWAIPISRVKSIIFSSEELEQQIVTITNLSSAYIPKHLPRVQKGSDDKVQLALTKSEKSTSQIDLANKINLFDRILGGLALLKLAGENYMNYSDNYFSTLAIFNTLIEEEIKKQQKPINPIFHDAFRGKDKFKSFFPFISKNVSEDDVIQTSLDEKQNIEKDRITGLIDLNSLDKMAYVLGILYTYGVGDEPKQKKIDSLIAANFKNGIRHGKSEIVALCYGLNRGYSVFSNQYNVGGNQKVVKFKLQSKLDYYTIESVFQFAFNNIYSNSVFKYLDEWIPNNKRSKTNSSTLTVLDEVIIERRRPKVGSIEYNQILSSMYFQKSHGHLFSPFIEDLVKKVMTDLGEESDLKPSNLEVTQSAKLDAVQEQISPDSQDLNLNDKYQRLVDLVSKIYKASNTKAVKQMIDNFKKNESGPLDLFNKPK